MIWKPDVTVAAVLETEGRFLLVEEITQQGLRFNQPAGHLEESESLLDASVRETLEESGYIYAPQAVLGIYQWKSPEKTFLRFAFTGTIISHDPDRRLDEGIIRAIWLTPEEIREKPCRSPMVLQCVEDYLADRRYPLDIINHYPIQKEQA